MATSIDIFENLFKRWKRENFSLTFYFEKIFDRVLKSVQQNTNHDLCQEIASGRYKALFAPIGYSIENVAVITAFIKPDFLMLAFSETTHRFHRKNLPLLKQNLNRVIHDIIVDETKITGFDQQYAEQAIIEWIKKMTSAHSFTKEQLAIDLTGGTKMMSIGAQNAALSFNEIDAFYLDVEYYEDTLHPKPGTERLLKLKKEKSQIDQNMVFVIMPFADNFNKIYKWIEETVTSSSLNCTRVDKEIFLYGIMDRIREDILKAGIIIAELSDKNLNVYYELGLSHGYHKNVIMLTQNIDEIPFDLRHLPMVIYKPNDKVGFQNQLSRRIEYCKQL